MFAVISLGGIQHKVKKDDIITINKLDAEVGQEISISNVLSLGAGATLQLGTPFVENAVVKAKVLEQTRDTKIIIFKKIRRHNYRRKNGHRQYITKLQITDIN